MLVVAPTGPGTVEYFTLNAVVRVDDAPFPNEGAYWTGKVGQLLHRLFGRGRLYRIATRCQAIAPSYRPDQNTGSFLAELPCQRQVFLSVEGLDQTKDDEPGSDCATRITQLWKFVGQDKETCRKLPIPYRQELSIDREPILARN